MDRRMTGFAGFLQDDEVNNEKRRIKKHRIFEKKDDDEEDDGTTLQRKMTLNEVYDKNSFGTDTKERNNVIFKTLMMIFLYIAYILMLVYF